jgi:predicted transcriptional regulator
MKNGSTDSESFPLPPALLLQVKAAAKEEHRPEDEIVREAVERYLDGRRWQRLLAYGEEQARKMGLSGADVPRIVDEYRREKRSGLR